jgi:diacylglycerol O-acyltransferase / wax synthase
MPDRVFLALESADTPQHVATLAVFAMPAEVEPDGHMRRLFEHLDTSPIVAPFTFRLRHPRRGVFDGSWDVLSRKDIDRSHHLRRCALPAPGGKRELLDLVSRLHATPLDTTRPLWECHVIEGLADGRFALYFKVHHALTDGLGSQQRLRQTLTTDPRDTGVRPMWSIVAVDDVAAAGKRPAAKPVADRIAGVATTAVGLGRAAGSMARGVRAMSDPARAVPFAIPRSPLNGAVGRQRRVVTGDYDLERFRAVAKAAEVTVNDVLLSVCGGALRGCLAAAGALPARAMTACTPVSTREAGDMTTANAFALTVVSLGTDVADLLERLRTVARSSTIAKRELGVLPTGATGLYGAMFTWPFVAQNVLGLGGGTRPPYNVVVSNIPGSSKQQYFAGSRLESIYPLGSVCHGVGLFIAARSAAGKLNLCLVGDRDAPVSLDDLGDRISRELFRLEQAMGLPTDVDTSTHGGA